MRSLVRSVTPFAIAALLPLSALAHPGHGEPGPGHYVTQPEHLLQLAILCGTVAVIVVYRAARRHRA